MRTPTKSKRAGQSKASPEQIETASKKQNVEDQTDSSMESVADKLQRWLLEITQARLSAAGFAKRFWQCCTARELIIQALDQLLMWATSSQLPARECRWWLQLLRALAEHSPSSRERMKELGPMLEKMILDWCHSWLGKPQVDTSLVTAKRDEITTAIDEMRKYLNFSSSETLQRVIKMILRSKDAHDLLQTMRLSLKRSAIVQL